MKALKELRIAIDSIDSHIQDLLTERAKIALEIGKHKMDGLPIYNPKREVEILNSIVMRNTGPLKNADLLKIFKTIIAINRGLQKKLRVAFLGPLGTFSHEAVIENFGETVDLKPQSTIKEIFKRVTEDEADYGLVPIENSTEGVVNQALDCLISTPLLICNEIVLPVHHSLLSREKHLASINQVYFHPQALAQCKLWLEKNLPLVATIPATSSSQACLLAGREANTAAIASKIALQYHNLNVIAKNIDDEANNATRFYVIGKQITQSTTKDKTALLIWIKHHPGSLVSVLNCIAENAINLTLIESHPCSGQVWQYYFFLEVEGHQDDSAIKKMLTRLTAKKKVVKILGSFPRGVL
jgi:chorismate mutase / prephenate dehydratase